MRGRRIVLVGALLTVMILPAPSSAGAEVPGLPFTSTECEAYSDSVARLYTAGLGRQPEQGGFDFWITEYTLGNWTFPRMAQFFVESPEFQESYGTLTQDGFIRQLYRNTLGREGEQSGVTFWNQQMSAGMSRATMLMRFAESPENIERSETVPPALGPFNEGRLPGPWRCGPPLTDSMLAIGDFFGISGAWGPSAGSQAPPSCSALRLPEVFDQVGFFNYTPQLEVPRPLEFTQASYIAPTPYGAERYMAEARQAISDCTATDIGVGYRSEFGPLSFPSYGDETAAARQTITWDELSLPMEWDWVVVRDGSVVTALRYWKSYSSTDSATIQAWVEVAVGRIADLPIGG